MEKENEKYEKTLNEYISKINSEEYSQMYKMISKESKNKISEEEFVNRNKNIYSGIDAVNVKIEII